LLSENSKVIASRGSLQGGNVIAMHLAENYRMAKIGAAMIGAAMIGAAMIGAAMIGAGT
jgi:hypothetical protein